MSKEYIEREAAIQLVQTEGFSEAYDLGSRRDNRYFCDELMRIPAADVVEVKHGWWIDSAGQKCLPNQRGYVISEYPLYCSKCHWYLDGGKSAERGLSGLFCPHCGAKMDGGMNDAAD